MATRELRTPSILLVSNSVDERCVYTSSPKHELLGPVVDNARPRNEGTCPQCRGLMEYRHKSPVLSALDPNSREPRDRLRYVSGWFCSDPACDYRELAQF
jgi:hypothetical protein